MEKERKGEYLGKTVQVIPHVTNEIKEFIYSAARKGNPDVLICEIGGTVGDIESQPFLEAIRQIGLENKKEDVLYIHVTLVPYLECGKEHKSKPTQHSVKELQGMGIKPDIILLRCSRSLPEDMFEKIALFCNIERECVIENKTIDVLYEVPLMLEKQHMADVVVKKLNLKCGQPDLGNWKAMVKNIKHLEKKVTIGLVGKYVKLHDAYLSVVEALMHGGYASNSKVHIKWIDSETINESNIENKISGCDGIIIPGGFGGRGIEGMVLTAEYCRTNNIPYLGICLGMQVATIEYSRNVCHLAGANSREFDENSPYKVIDFLPDQSDEVDKGGTLRLGAYECNLKSGTLIRELYGVDTIHERHRHRYEFNNDYREILADGGLSITGTHDNGRIVETVEIPSNDYFIGVQFHPEFKSRPDNPHPLFRGFIKAAVEHKEGEEHE